MGLLGIYITIYQSVISAIATEYAINSTKMGMVISLHFIGSVAAPAIFGEISERIGKRATALIALSIMILGLLSVYFFKSLVVISMGIFLIGCGFAVIEGTLTGVLSELNLENTNRVINLSQMFFSIGAVAGPLISILSISLFGSWKASFLLMIILFGLITAYLSRLEFNIKKVTTEIGKGLIVIRLFKEKIFIYLCISIFIYVGIEEGVAFWLNTYFKSTFNSSQLGPYALSGYWASMIIGRYLASRFHNKHSLFLKGGLLISLSFFVVAFLFKNDMLDFICFLIIGFGFSAVWPIIMSMTASFFPKYVGTAFGVMMTSAAVGGIFVPLFIGLVINFMEIRLAFWAIPILIIGILYIMKKIS